MIKIQVAKIAKNKKGFIDILLWGLFGLFSNVWVLLGTGIFILVILLLAYFALGRIIGAIMIVASLWVLIKGGIRWWMALILIGIGILMMLNPFGWAALQFVR